jgi:glucosylceramidase
MLHSINIAMSKSTCIYACKIILPVFLITILSCTQNEIIEMTSSSPSGMWQKQSIQVTVTQPTPENPDILIGSQKVEQVITGFGGCFNELGWEALQSLPKPEQDNILSALFDTVSGCKFTLCRMPIGANDYAVDWYSYDETPGDFEMKNFSISRDEIRLIPYIKMARAINQHLQIWASPWCPPSWMKTNNHYACSASKDFNDLPDNMQGTEMKTQFRMEDNVLKAYALYFQKFIEAYAAQGIPIYAIHPQNELNSCQVFPSCIWRPEDIARFIGGYLGPQLESAGLKTSLFMGTIERPQIERVDTILQNTAAKKYIRGVGFQWAGKDAIPLVHKKYPELLLMQTETECGDGSNDWKAARHTWELMRHYFSNGANAYMYWNMVLDETGKSQWGWKQNSMISINRETGQVVYNPEFYLMKHLAAYVSPGDYYLPVDNPNCLAFRNKERTILILFNPLETEKTMKIRIKGMDYNIPLPAGSFNTLIL